MSSYKWIIGVLLASLSSIISNIGLTLQKLSHKKNLKLGILKAEEHKNNYYKDPIWFTGLILIIIGSVADLSALGFAAQSVIAPLGSLTLVSNVLLAPLILNENLDNRDIISTLSIVFGSGLAVAFASHDDQSYTISQLFAFYTYNRFIIYCIFIIIIILIMLYYIDYIEKLPDSLYSLYRTQHRFLYSSLSGIIGAQSVLFAKSFAELMSILIRLKDASIFTYFQTYIVIIMMVACILLQIKYMNSALLRFDSVTVVPIFQSFWILVSVIAGLVFFGEGADFTVTQALMFPLGVFITIGGIYFLSLRETSNEERNINESIDLDSIDPVLNRRTSRKGSNVDSMTSFTQPEKGGPDYRPVSTSVAESYDDDLKKIMSP